LGRRLDLGHDVFDGEVGSVLRAPFVLGCLRYGGLLPRLHRAQVVSWVSACH